MARITIDTWNPDFLNLSLIFDSIRDVAIPFTQLKHWPTLEQFADEFGQDKILSRNGKRIQPVAQGEAPEKFDELYESRIFLKGELQTRLENWHDFFNAMCWLQFPKMKSALNALHFEHSQTREAGSNRSALENAITLFDECGAIIVSDDENLLQLIRQHQWKELFVKHRKAFTDKDTPRQIRVYVVGHAMHEKALTPYLGMTTHSILIHQPTAFFEQSQLSQLQQLDEQIAGLWQEKTIASSKDLQPYPLLGTPHWWQDAQDDDFYNNNDYFRAKKIS
ncbi:MAG: DUF3025 domain-containing protein [Gammaproteobacteria bacterium]|nr:DUF3025 domain-containing protein [Gammaproteobacteria bacterium]